MRCICVAVDRLGAEGRSAADHVAAIGYKHLASTLPVRLAVGIDGHVLSRGCVDPFDLAPAAFTSGHDFYSPSGKNCRERDSNPRTPGNGQGSVLLLPSELSRHGWGDALCFASGASRGGLEVKSMTETFEDGSGSQACPVVGCLLSDRASYGYSGSRDHDAR